jgi:hypothetical protein
VLPSLIHLEELCEVGVHDGDSPSDPGGAIQQRLETFKL